MIHDEGIEKVVEWLERCDNRYEREYAQNAIKGLRELQQCRKEKDALQKRYDDLRASVNKAVSDLYEWSNASPELVGILHRHGLVNDG